MTEQRPKHRQPCLCKCQRPGLAADRWHQLPSVTLIWKNQGLLAFLEVVTAVTAPASRENIDPCCLRARNLFVDSKMIAGISALIDCSFLHIALSGLVEIRRRILNTLDRAHKHNAGRTKLSARHRS